MILQLLSDDSFVDVQVGNPVPIHRERVAFAGGQRTLNALQESFRCKKLSVPTLRFQERDGLYLLKPASERAHVHECQWASCTLWEQSRVVSCASTW